MRLSTGQELRRQALRAQMGRRRSSLDTAQVESYSRAIAAKLMELAPLRSARVIMGFAGIGNEVDLRPWLEAQVEQGKNILLPRVENDNTLAAVQFTGWSSALPGPFGIMEPVGAQTSPNDIEAVIVPGLVFDVHGYRLGYGKGYYDRFLRLVRPTTFICGVCYEFQVVDDIGPHSGDVPVHWIVTEKTELPINADFF